MAPEAFNQLATNLSTFFYRETLRHRRLENAYNSLFGFLKDIGYDSIGEHCFLVSKVERLETTSPKDKFALLDLGSTEIVMRKIKVIPVFILSILG